MAKQLRRRQKTFCTECGSDLDEFWLSPGAANYEDILKRHMECQREGRFKGSLCSKLFIADGGTPDASRNPDPAPTRKNSRLKKSIMKKISDEDGKSATS